MESIDIIDSHTGGEPTRVVVAGLPDLGDAPLNERLNLWRNKFDGYRSAIVNEPRGSDVIVGAAIVPPTRKDCAAGVIFFNNVGYLHMCGHGTIGLMVTLKHIGRIDHGTHRIETPVGIVQATLHDDNSVSVRNVPAQRYRKAIEVDVPGIGTVTGDIAWGGNWFFLAEAPDLQISVANQQRLTEVSWQIRRALEREGIQAPDGEIDHIELFGPPSSPETADSRNFVLCPGGAYDRSPCGTGTSAKLACLYEDGKLAPGAVWKQESVAGSVFEGSVEIVNGEIIPTIRGSAFITAQSQLLIDPEDPFRWGISA